MTLLHTQTTNICIYLIYIIFLEIGNSLCRLYNTQSKSDWLFNTQSRILETDWLKLENNEKATLNIDMPYSMMVLVSTAVLYV